MNDRPRAWNSTLPVPESPLRRKHWLNSGPVDRAESTAPEPLRTRNLRAVAGGSGTGGNTIPDAVLKLVDDRDGHFCVRCGRYREVIEHHHRRIKGYGGDTREHAECPCCIVSLCPWWSESACHPWAHANRVEAEAEGLIIPRAAEFPFLYSVLVHSQFDGSGHMAWPTCEGRWDANEPEGTIAC